MPRVRDRDNSRGGLRAPDAAIARHVVRRVQPDEAERRRSRFSGVIGARRVFRLRHIVAAARREGVVLDRS
jgi:hypothetical protein